MIMTTINKGSLVNGTYALMRISGLTVDPTSEDIVIGLQVADDFAAQLKEEGLDLGWQYPSDYGLSDPADNSGLSVGMAGPFKKLLFLELCAYFGKAAPLEVISTAREGRRALEQMLVSVPPAQNPPTLPVGSGNEWGVFDSRFYPDPPNNRDAQYVYKGDVLNETHDFSGWLAGETLVSAVWSTEDNSIAIGASSFTDTVATAPLTFNQSGGGYVLITATKTNSTDQLTIKKNFVISDPNYMGTIWNA
jgi:hypothetical protein